MGDRNIKLLTVGLVVGLGMWKLWKIYQKMFAQKKELYYKCLFFTPKQITCNSKCSSNKFLCKMESFPCNKCSFKSLSSLLVKAKKHLDICMYLITYPELCDIILRVHRRGIEVRIIMDKSVSEDAAGAKSKILKFQREFVPIKIIKSSYMMHNKFAVIDSETVLIGSVNWTRQGFTGNYENLLVLTHSEIAKKYNEYFDLLWAMKAE